MDKFSSSVLCYAYRDVVRIAWKSKRRYGCTWLFMDDMGKKCWFEGKQY